MEIPRYNVEILSHCAEFEEKLCKTKQEHEYFINTGKVRSNNIISAEVLSSWIRCRNRGLDPRNILGTILPEIELDMRLKANSMLLDIVSPFLEAIADSIKGTGFRVDIYDSELYLLKEYGDPKLNQSYKHLQSKPGVSRSEVNIGTNAMNLSVLLERPVQLVGPEHYNVALHDYTCTAVPIKDPNGKIEAVINTAGYYWLMHRHTLGMMIALGKSIEYSLYQNRIRQEIEITNGFKEAIIESISDALIVVDNGGRIIAANRRVQELFETGGNIVGYPIELLCGVHNPFSEVLATAEPMVDREILLNVEGKNVRMLGTVRPIMPGELGLQGVIGTFKNMNTTRRMIKKFAGWKAHFTFNDLIGESSEFRQAVRLAKETARIQSNILLQGESGTGKELFAQAIHNGGRNSEGPFVAVNCAAIPSGLLESELFGYEGGAFTGAKKEGQPGKFELADCGTIFLDEINSLPLDMQAKLLRTLQNRTVMRLGGNEEMPINSRIISASNADLWQMVKRGEFREDLFYRINVITVSIPPLREREGDLELLVKYIAHRLSAQLSSDILIDNEAINLMKSYHWPGNVRELENVVERSYVLARTRGMDIITLKDVENYPGIQEITKTDVKMNVKLKNEFQNNLTGLKDLEKEAFQKALEATNGNIAQAAQALGVARNTFYRKIKSYGLGVEHLGKCPRM